ncbi:DUF1802 family protein [Thermoactinomyces daqus]|uniref:DUF1802 family protein n=1 Tax=Thermoactinomyces daqus TaxID=1329516 RepID=A0A7W1XD46_9BACL|nr:DUF1802 family protein [Thermoactinomyces daqus]MBA4544465.1 DUF1802 family protein [Thermoactinomyces daqus]
MSRANTRIALKEWAVTVEALGEGKQIIVMRKGGIAEETRHFEVRSDRFFLYPAYEHQKEELLKPEYRAEIAKTLQSWSPEQETATIKYFAELHEDIEVMDEEALFRLAPCHIWTNDFAHERLKWKKKLPLHLLLLRVYRLDQPARIPIRPEYSGCKSWHEVPQELADCSGEPVMKEADFLAEVNKIKALLAGQK